MDKPIFNVGENCTGLLVEDDIVKQQVKSVTLKDAVFIGNLIANAKFEWCTFNKAIFDACIISSTVFDSCNFAGASFEHCELQYVTFKACTGIKANTFKCCTFISCLGHECNQTPEQTSQNKLFKTFKQVQRNERNKSNRPF